MRAIILAAGRGERMRPLTDTVPKPLLEIDGKPLIQYHIERLVRAGTKDIVINHGRLGHLIEERLGEGNLFNVHIHYSAEGDAPLETGGGIFRALNNLGPDPFIVVNADIWTDYPYEQLPVYPAGLVHLVMVPNPPQHPEGDFGLREGWLTNRTGPRYTYSGIGVYRPELFRGQQDGKFPLAPLLRQAIEQRAVSGEVYRGDWADIGTPERLQEIRNRAQK